MGLSYSNAFFISLVILCSLLLKAQAELIPFSLQAATGFFELFNMTFGINSSEDNVVDMEFNLDIFVSSGSLSTFNFNLMEEGLGGIVPGSVSVFQDGDPVNFSPTISDDGFRKDNDGFLETSVRISTVSAGGSTRLTYFYEVTDIICRHRGDAVVSANWATGLTTIRTDNLEFTYILNMSEFPSVFDHEISPISSGQTVRASDESYKVTVDYPTSRVDFGESTGRRLVFFKWEGVQFAGDVDDCPDESTNLSFLFLLIIVPLISCLCLVSVSIMQRFSERNQSRRNAGGTPSRPRLRYFPGNRDIVLIPEAEDHGRQNGRITTVRAVNEETDLENRDFENVVPVTTIQVDLRNDRSTEQVSASRAVDSSESADTHPGEVEFHVAPENVVIESPSLGNSFQTSVPDGEGGSEGSAPPRENNTTQENTPTRTDL